MKTTLLSLCLAVAIAGPALAADPSEALAGKWSGNWTPQGGIPDSMTIELTHESPERLTGRFLSPVPMEFTRAAFDPKTHTVTVEATDQKSGKQYRINGKIQGTEIKGTLSIDNAKADLLLIKWTYFGR
jgi:hypothetical protein